MSAPRAVGQSGGASAPSRHRHVLRSLGRRAAPFVVVLLGCLYSPAIPHGDHPIAGWWIAATVALTLTAVAAIVEAAARDTADVVVAPMIVFAAIELLRFADGNATSGFSVLVVLPVLWCALFVSLRAVLVALVGALAALALPLVVIGSPQYPWSSARGSLLLFLVTVTVGFVVRRLVDANAAKTATSVATADRFRTVFETAPNGLALVTGELTETTELEIVNPALCAVLGRSEDELVGARLAALVHPAYWHRLLTAASTAQSDPAEVVFIRRSGRPVWTEVSLAELATVAGQSQFAVRVVDTSARRAADEAMIQALEAERSAAEHLRRLNESKSTLMSTISHDLRTPITSALGYAELLVDEQYGPMTPDQTRAVNTVARGLQRLSRIVAELVAERTVAAEQAELEIFDLGELFDDAGTAIAMQATAKAQSLEITGSFDGVQVAGNQIRLSRALDNLLGNAVKFTPQHGTITLTASLDDGTAVIAVGDSGDGISEQDQKRIFDRFYRAPRADDAEGSGLGLAIVSAIIAQHGGTIEVASTPGEGAVFTIRIPVAK